MGESDDMSGTVRVIALLSPTAAVPAPDLEAEFVRVNSGYEAAAELLSAPSAALLVDLGRITPPHAPLLSLASRLGVPVVAFGTISADLASEALANARLSSPERAAEALAEAVGERPASEVGMEEVGVEQGDPAPVGADDPPPTEDDAPAQPPTDDAEPPPATTAGLPPAEPARPPGNLTQGELDALLGEP